MKKILAVVAAVVLVLTLLTGCMPKTTNEEATQTATDLLNKVIRVFEVGKYEIAHYSDGVFMQYISGETYYYLVENFNDIFDTTALLSEATVKLKGDLGLMITPVDGTFIKCESYDQFVGTLFTGNYTLTVDTIEDIEIFCTVECEYLVSADSEEVTTLKFPMVIHRYAREITDANGKVQTEYYWLISELFNPLNPSTAIAPEVEGEGEGAEQGAEENTGEGA